MRFPTDSLSSPPGGEAVYSRKNERKTGKGRWRFGSLLFDQDFCNFFFFLLLFNHASQFRFLNYFNILNSLETNLYVDVIFDLMNLSGKQGILDVRWKHFFSTSNNFIISRLIRNGYIFPSLSFSSIFQLPAGNLLPFLPSLLPIPPSLLFIHSKSPLSIIPCEFHFHLI